MLDEPQIVAVAGLPGSGKSTLVREYEAKGYRAFDDPGAEWSAKLDLMREARARGEQIIVAEIMFCMSSWREELEAALDEPVHWIWFENYPWQCGVNCLYRLMVQLDDRPLMAMLYRIAELSPQYAPPAGARLVVASDAPLRRPVSSETAGAQSLTGVSDAHPATSRT